MLVLHSLLYGCAKLGVTAWGLVETAVNRGKCVVRSQVKSYFCNLGFVNRDELDEPQEEKLVKPSSDPEVKKKSRN